MPPTAPVNIKLDAIEPSPHNPRKIDPKAPSMQELAKSIKELGLLQPVSVRIFDNSKGKYQLIAGERRWRAAIIAGIESIPAIIHDVTDAQAAAFTVVENLQREDLSVLEESQGVNSLQTLGWPANDIAEKLGKPLSWVVRRARIDKLHPKLKKEWLSDKSAMPKWSARALERIALLEPAAQLTFMAEFGKHDFRNVSYESLETAIAEHTRFLSGAPWKLDDATVDPKAGACLSCTKRASCTPGLFDDIDTKTVDRLPKNDRCLDPDCWTKKARAFTDKLIPTFLDKHPTGVLFSTTTQDESHKPPVLRLFTHYPKKQPHHNHVIHGLWIDGPLAGTITPHYMDEYSGLVKYDKTTKGKKPKHNDAPPEKKPKPPTKPTPKQAEKILEERQEALDARRAALITQSVLDELRKHENRFMHKDMTETEAWEIIDLAFHVGADGCGRVGNVNPVAVPKHKNLTETALTAWNAMHRHLTRWLTQHQANAALAALPNVRHVANLCRIKWDALEIAAATAIPEPKSWEKLRASQKKK